MECNQVRVTFKQLTVTCCEVKSLEKNNNSLLNKLLPGLTCCWHHVYIHLCETMDTLCHNEKGQVNNLMQPVAIRCLKEGAGIKLYRSCCHQAGENENTGRESCLILDWCWPFWKLVMQCSMYKTTACVRPAEQGFWDVGSMSLITLIWYRLFSFLNKKIVVVLLADQHLWCAFEHDQKNLCQANGNFHVPHNASTSSNCLMTIFDPKWAMGAEYLWCLQ